MRHGHNSRRHHRGGGRGNGGHGGHGGHGNHGGGGGGGHNNGRRFNPRVQAFDSNGPDVRIRGNAFQITEKYLSLARDAAAAGDRVLAESYLQHAEHYQRMLNEAAIEFGEAPQAAIQPGGYGGGPVDPAQGEQPEVSVQPMNGQEEIPAPGDNGASQPQQSAGGQQEQRHHRHMRHPRRAAGAQPAATAVDAPQPPVEPES